MIRISAWMHMKVVMRTWSGKMVGDALLFNIFKTSNTSHSHLTLLYSIYGLKVASVGTMSFAGFVLNSSF
jgi:hypothetical protein